MPSAIRDSCNRAVGDDTLGRTKASLRCDLPLNADADTVWYHRYRELAGNERLPVACLTRNSSCQTASARQDVSRAQGTYQIGGTHSGSAYCYQADGKTWIVWTYDADRILARALRDGGGITDWHTSDSHGLYDWWSQIRLFLQSGG